MDVGRAVLFVPGDRPDRIVKALATPADAVAVDLEDAVAAPEKAAARTRTAETLSGITDGSGPGLFVRINPLETAEAEEDLSALPPVLATRCLTGLIVPKAGSAPALARLGARLTALERAAGATPGALCVVPVVETARAVLESFALATACPRVRTLLFGTLDLAAELGVRPSAGGAELAHARSQVVLAARAAGLTGPLDGPWASLDDEEGLLRSSRAARELGFTGRVVLHPRQVGPVRRAFAPTDEELVRAREILAADRAARERGVGAMRLPDGTFVDRPVVTRAAALLHAAGADEEVTS